MKSVVTVTVLVSIVFFAGCSQKEQVKVTFLSDPPGGMLYKQNGQLWGPCPKTLWYDIDSQAIEEGFLNAKGMTVRWPTGPAKQSDDLIKITVNGTDRHVIFAQPKDKTTTVATEMHDPDSNDLSEKGAEWQKAQKTKSVENERIEAPPAISKQPVAEQPKVEEPVVAEKVANRLPGRTLTLAPKQLMLLDFSSLNRRGASIKSKRIVTGPGVEFDIFFPSNTPGSCSMSYVSSGTGGRGTLVGTDIRVYEAFALKMTLVSINNRSDRRMKQKLVVGAVIGPTAEGRLTSFKPVTLSMAPDERTTTAVTPVSADEIYEIGFHIRAENYEEWDESGSRVLLRIEPIPGGEAGIF